MGRPDVYVLGRVIADIYGNEINVELKEVKSFNKYLGGSAGNTAVGLARHGANVGLISRVGNDAHGEYLLDTLTGEGIDVDMVHKDDAHATGLAFAALRPPSDSELLFYCTDCAYEHLHHDDLDEQALQSSKVLVVCATTLAREESRLATMRALELHRAAGGINVMDVDWRPMFWPDKAFAKSCYEDAIRLVDVLIANEPELAFVGASEDVLTARDHVSSLGPRELVAKRGAQGVHYFGPEGEVKVPAFQIDVLNTLGAGDGFGAAYTFGLLQGWSVRERLRYASAAGAIVVTRHSCSDAMPTQVETQAFLSERREEESVCRRYD